MRRAVVNGLLAANLALLVATSRVSEESEPLEPCDALQGSASFEIAGEPVEASVAPDTASDTGVAPESGRGLVAFDLTEGWSRPEATGELILTNADEEACSFAVLAGARGTDLATIDPGAFDPAAPPEGFELVAHGELGGAIWADGSLTPGRAKVEVTDVLTAVDCEGARVAVVGCDGVSVLTDLDVTACEPTCGDTVPELLVEPL